MVTREPGRVVLALFVLIALLVTVDLVTDLREHVTVAHVLLELVVIGTGVAAATVTARRLRQSAQEAHRLRVETGQLAEDLRRSREEAAHWRRENAELVAGLSAAIDTQLVSWGLTAAEREVALLLLKGLSHKEIADVRAVSETTVRQQARSLYRKAGLGGRNDLAAFFLEDLLGPRS